MIVHDHTAWGSAFHPQDALTVHVVAAMVQAMTDLRTSPLTGAPMGAAVVTGDSADMHSHLELRWFIDLMDGHRWRPTAADPTCSRASRRGPTRLGVPARRPGRR